MLEKTTRTTPSRYANQRMSYDEAVVFPILDDALFCTVSYSVDNQPFSIPTAFVRKENKLYIHGSVGSHFLREIEKGIPVCISVMLTDALVVAKSAFHHSVIVSLHRTANHVYHVTCTAQKTVNRFDTSTLLVLCKMGYRLNLFNFNK